MYHENNTNLSKNKMLLLLLVVEAVVVIVVIVVVVVVVVILLHTECLKYFYNLRQGMNKKNQYAREMFPI